MSLPARSRRGIKCVLRASSFPDPFPDTSGRGFGSGHRESVPYSASEPDPYAPDPEVERRVNLMKDYDKRIDALKEGIGAEVKAKLSGLNVFVVGSDVSANSFLAEAFARTLDYTPFTSSELCEKSTGLSWKRVLEKEGEDELRSLELMLLQSFGEVKECAIGTFGTPAAAAADEKTWEWLRGALVVWLEDTIGDTEGMDVFTNSDVKIIAKPAGGLEKYLNSADQVETALHELGGLASSLLEQKAATQESMRRSRSKVDSSGG